MINTGDPDIGLVQEKVAAAIDQAEGQAPPPSHRKPKPKAVTGGSLGSLSGGYAANQSDDVGSAC